MIIIKLGSDSYEFEGGKFDFENFRKMLLKNKTQPLMRIPTELTGDSEIHICPDKITSFYFVEADNGARGKRLEQDDTMGTGSVEEGVKEIPRRRGRPKKV